MESSDDIIVEIVDDEGVVPRIQCGFHRSPLSHGGGDVEGCDRVGLSVGLSVDLSDSTFVGGESDGESASFISLRELVEKQESEPRVKTERGVKLERTEEERKELVTKYRDLMGIKPVPKVEADFTRREKVMVTNVRSFNDAEARRFTAAMKRETDGYVADFMERVLHIHPFNRPLERTAAQVGLPLRSVARFCSQAKKDELTPKRRSGRPAIEVPEWVLIDIRNIITRKL